MLPPCGLLTGAVSIWAALSTSGLTGLWLAEIYGEREGTRRMTNMVLQSQIEWATLERSDNGKMLTRKKPMLRKGRIWCAR